MPESGIVLVSFFGVRVSQSGFPVTRIAEHVFFGSRDPYSLVNSVNIVRTYEVQNIKTSTSETKIVF